MRTGWPPALEGPTLAKRVGFEQGPGRPRRLLAAPMSMPGTRAQVVFLVMVAALLVIPRIPQRWRIPAPPGAFAPGWLVATLAGDVLPGQVLHILSSLGISAVFLFAGVEVEPEDFRRGRGLLPGSLLANALSLGGHGPRCITGTCAGRWRQGSCAMSSPSPRVRSSRCR